MKRKVVGGLGTEGRVVFGGPSVGLTAQQEGRAHVTRVHETEDGKDRLTGDERER